jgi:ADP-ribose pyrophosphatase YjhB (NUDIX family)
MELQVGVKAFLRDSEGRYLLVRRSEAKYGKTQGSWDIVGGRINPGSALVENLKREVLEETRLNLTSNPVLIAAQDIIPNDTRHVVRLSYVANTAGQPILDEENLEYKWVTLEEMQQQEDLDRYVKDIMDQGLLKS